MTYEYTRTVQRLFMVMAGTVACSAALSISGVCTLLMRKMRDSQRVSC